MKKFATLILVTILGYSVSFAEESAHPVHSDSSSLSYASKVSIPTGVFFNGQNFVKVESDWVGIKVGSTRKDYSIRNAEKDPYGNYALVLSNGESITIYSDGRSLYYNRTKYTKR